MLKNQSDLHGKYKVISYQLSLKERLDKIFDTITMKILNVILTFYILFADDIRLLCTTKDTDLIFSCFVIAILMFYIFELVSFSIMYEEYFLSLFFIIDLAALGSLTLDIHWVTDSLIQNMALNDRDSYSNRFISIIRLSRIIRLSTRVTRILRVTRAIKFFKIFSNSDADNNEQSKVGKQLEDLTMKRLVTLILLMLFAIIFLSTYFYYNQLTYMEFGINLFNQFANLNRSESRYYNVTRNVYIDQQINAHIPLLYAQIYENTYGNITALDDLRYIETLEVWAACSNKVQKNTKKILYNCYAAFDNRSAVKSSTIINIANTTIIIGILAFGVYYFNKDMNDLVLEPIEKMTMKIKKLSRNPIEAIIKNSNKEGGELGSKKGCCGFNKKKDAPLETVILEQTLSKISALLALGFGEAGAEIISKNIGNTVDVDMDPTIEGKKVMCIYGFCDIRNFTDSTEVLQEKVMIFVNEIAEIVHQTTSEYGGSANKNIGDAFLLVWKFDEKFIKHEDGELILKECQEVSEMVDMALIAFIKIITRCHKSAKINKVKSILT
jgi:hypothetical protein